jgi:hypothetical protein
MVILKLFSLPDSSSHTATSPYVCKYQESQLVHYELKILHDKGTGRMSMEGHGSQRANGEFMQNSWNKDTVIGKIHTACLWNKANSPLCQKAALQSYISSFFHQRPETAPDNVFVWILP